MMEEPSTDLKVEHILHDQHDKGTDRAGCHFDRGEKPKAERQHEQEINVPSCNYLIDGELQVKRTDDHECFENDRQHQNLQERMPAAVQLRPKCRERKSRPLVFRKKTVRRRELERNAGQMLGGFG